MKIIPSNQTLILAGERGPSAMPAVRLPRSAGSTGNDPVLQRLTIVAARPDSTMVYLRADYAAGGHSSFPAASSSAYDVTGTDVVPAQTQRSLVRAETASPSDPYGSSRGISLYASTQRMSLGTVTAMLDVHA